METVNPQTKDGPTVLDYQRAVKDTAYFKEVMADPKLKEEYNAEMLKKQF